MNITSAVLNMALLMTNTFGPRQGTVHKSLLECTASCYRNSTCASIYYHESTTSCSLQTDIYDSDSDSDSDSYSYSYGEASWLYYAWEPADCPASQGWRYRRNTNFCFILGGPETYHTAESWCEERGGGLVVADSSEKLDYLQTVAPNRDFWIRHPDIGSTDGQCEMMSGSTGQHTIENCLSAADFFCERTTDGELFLPC